jgi:uncharacterized protein
MRIICIEEHCTDPDIEMASHAAMTRQAPYMHDLQLPGPGAKHAPKATDQLTPPNQAPTPCIDESRVALMDRCGIDTQIVSYSSPTQFAPIPEALALASSANDRLARACEGFPGRLYGLATLPWQDPVGAENELTRAVETLGIKGAMIIGRPAETFLDDERYAGVLKKFHDLNVPLYVHPFAPMLGVQKNYYAGLDPAVSAAFSLGGLGLASRSRYPGSSYIAARSV